MDIYTFLYLADKVDVFATFLIGFGGAGCVLFFLASVEAFVNCAPMQIRNTLFLFFLIFCMFIGVGTLIPSRDFMYQAGAVYLGKEVIKNEQVQEAFNKVKKVIDLNLDKQIKELNGDKTNGT